MKSLLLLLLLPLSVLAQENDNPINPNSAKLMAAFNKEYIARVNLKRKEIGLNPVVESDSLTKLATHYVGLFIGIGEGDLPSVTTHHYFSGMLISGSEIKVQDIIKAHWVGSGDGRFPGIKPHYTKVGIGGILRTDDLLSYVIFE